MILYRVNENLLYGNNKRIPKDAIHSLGKLSKESISILLARDRISMYRAPPLEMLPGFKYRSKRLKKFNMGTIELYGMSTSEIVEKTGLREKLVDKWKCELKDALGIKDEIERSG